MPLYCLDSDVFIQAKNGPYGMDIAPTFWEWLDTTAEEGTIFCPKMVYYELAEGNDELADWAKERRTTIIFREPSEDVQLVFQDIANYVESNYEQYYSSEFLDGADPWVIAHASTENATVVTHETLVGDNSRRVKIPNVCKEFDVEFSDPYSMLRNLGARF